MSDVVHVCNGDPIECWAWCPAPVTVTPPRHDGGMTTTEINLTGRKALCSSCKREEPSSTDLPFFEYNGPGSRAEERCGFRKPEWAEGMICGLRGAVAHQEGRTGFGHEYVPCGISLPVDGFYCGCRGWD